MAVPAGAEAAASPSMVSWKRGMPLWKKGASPSMWKVKTGAPTTSTRSCAISRSETAWGAAGRKPSKSGCSSGKAMREAKGAVITGAPRRSARATSASPAPSASTSDPATISGRRAAAIARAAAAMAAGSGAISADRRRGCTGWQVADQSSAGMETKQGPKGRCMAMRCAWAMAAGTSAARAGSMLNFT